MVARQQVAQRGLTLVELMVSMTIGLLILGALVALFVNTSGSNREFARINSVIENGRLAVQLLENEVMHGGFWGTFVPEFDDQTLEAAVVPGDVPDAVPDPCRAFDPATWTPQHLANLIGIPLQASDADIGTCGGIITDRLPGTDALVVRHAERCEPGGGPNCEPLVAGRLYFQPSRCDQDVSPYVIGVGGFDLRQRDCASPAELRQYVSDLYYVRNFAVTAGDGIPTLVRSRFDIGGGVINHQPAIAMVEGVQGFRVQFGIDDLSRTGEPVDYTAPVLWDDPDERTLARNRGDGAPDGPFVRCTAATPCNAAELANVTAVKIYVLARSRDPSPGYTDVKTYDLGDGVVPVPFNDAFKRHLFVTTVRLPNVSGRRMTP
jgi:type IV pilus assembly protein PilW